MPGGYYVAPVNIRPVNVGQALAEAEAIKGAKLRNELTTAKIAHDTAVTNALASALSPGTASPSAPVGSVPPPAVGAFNLDQPNTATAAFPTTSPGNAAAPSSASVGGIDLNSPAVHTLMALDPKAGSQLVTAVTKMNADQRARAKAQNEATAKLLIAVDRAAPQDRPYYYHQAIAQARRWGIPTGNAPAEFDQNWVKAQIYKSLSLDQILNMGASVEKYGTAEMKNYNFAVNQLHMNPQQAASWARQTKDMSPQGVWRDVYGKAMAATTGDNTESTRAADAATQHLFPGWKPAGGKSGSATQTSNALATPSTPARKRYKSGVKEFARDFVDATGGYVGLGGPADSLFQTIFGKPGASPAPKAAGGTSYPPAPRDPSRRQLDHIYTSPNGQHGRWTGQGWVLVP